MEGRKVGDYPRVGFRGLRFKTVAWYYVRIHEIQTDCMSIS